MVIEVDDTFVLVMLETLRTCANAVEMNGPASYMLAQELADLGKPMEALTLGELQAALDRVDVRYHSMEERYRSLQEPVPSGSSVLRLVIRGKVWVNGRGFTSPELVLLEGQKVFVEVATDSYSLLAWVAPYDSTAKEGVFQIHHNEAAARKGPAATGTQVSAEWLNSLASSPPQSPEGTEPDPQQGET